MIDAKNKASIFFADLNEKGQAFSQIGLGNARKAAALLQEGHSLSALLAHYHDQRKRKVIPQSACKGNPATRIH